MNTFFENFLRSAVTRNDLHDVTLLLHEHTRLRDQHKLVKCIASYLKQHYSFSAANFPQIHNEVARFIVISVRQVSPDAVYRQIIHVLYQYRDNDWAFEELRCEDGRLKLADHIWSLIKAHI